MKNGKAILVSIENILKIIILPIVTFCLLIEYVPILGISYWRYVYGITILLCLFSLFFTFISKVKRIAYIIFSIAILFLYLMNNNVPEIIEVHKKMDCLEIGQSWDSASGTFTIVE